MGLDTSAEPVAQLSGNFKCNHALGINPLNTLRLSKHKPLLRLHCSNTCLHIQPPTKKQIENQQTPRNFTNQAKISLAPRIFYAEACIGGKVPSQAFSEDERAYKSSLKRLIFYHQLLQAAPHQIVPQRAARSSKRALHVDLQRYLHLLPRIFQLFHKSS